jgi:hypothetical protein
MRNPLYTICCLLHTAKLRGYSAGLFSTQFTQMSTENSWACRELARIEALPNSNLIFELTNAMNGHTYSWRSIQTTLRHLDTNDSLYLDWSDLCSLKRKWNSIPSLTRESNHEDIIQGLSRDSSRRTWNPNHLRKLLTILILIPFRAGLKEEQGIWPSFYRSYILKSIAIQLVTQNLDKSSMGLEDLWIPYEKESAHMMNKSWDTENMIGEETPLLRYNANSQKLRWWWGKWFSWT